MERFVFFLSLLLGLLAVQTAQCRELTIDEAIAKIKAEAKSAVISAFRAEDKSGDFQFVDAKINSVHEFNDYTYGSMLENFEEILKKRAHLATSDAPSAMWPDERRAVLQENPRMLEYAKNNLTRVVGYSAVVDFVGITKFREQRDISAILYFDSDGKYIDAKGVQWETLLLHIVGAESSEVLTSRDDSKKKMVTYMFKQITDELCAANDPLFLRKDYWISSFEHGENAGKGFDMQWCYRLTKENTDEQSIDKGKFRGYYYQVQTGTVQTIKMLLLVEGTYEKDKKHIWFSYDNADVSSYHISYEATPTFSPGNYQNIDYRKCIIQLIESRKLRKFIRTQNNTPASYKYIDHDTFQMVAPLISDEPCTFRLSK